MEFPDPPWYGRVIIAMKGLPCTGKSELAREIGVWAKCPVFYIDDFLYTLSKEKGYTTTNPPPSPEEVDRLHRVAFDGLCKAAARQLHFLSNCVVIKSRLVSTFELDRLAELSREFEVRVDRIILIECQTKNEHRLRMRLRIKRKEDEWYRPRSWKDIEKVKEECDIDAQDNWDLHLLRLLDKGSFWSSIVIRLVLEPFNDLQLRTYYAPTPTPTSSLQLVLSHLIKMTSKDRQEDPNLRSDPRSSQYMVVQFNKERRYLMEKELQRARSEERRNYLCADDGGQEGKYCVFKYLPGGMISSDSSEPAADNHIINCGVCEERVSGQPAYTCHFCFLTLHKSCAELNGVEPLLNCSSFYDLASYPFISWEHLHRCKSCKEKRKAFSYGCSSCNYQTHLKGRRFPTIIYHDSHPEHLLSLKIDRFSKSTCNACEGCWCRGSYACYICTLNYGITCAFMPRELEHVHGGHKHHLKLMYSHDHEEEEEETYWCEVCYKDMDPQYWFYSCQACPFVAHPRCTDPYSKYKKEWRRKKEST